jgi:hypothetical protein
MCVRWRWEGRREDSEKERGSTINRKQQSAKKWMDRWRWRERRSERIGLAFDRAETSMHVKGTLSAEGRFQQK